MQSRMMLFMSPSAARAQDPTFIEVPCISLQEPELPPVCAFTPPGNWDAKGCILRDSLSNLQKHGHRAEALAQDAVSLMCTCVHVSMSQPGSRWESAVHVLSIASRQHTLKSEISFFVGAKCEGGIAGAACICIQMSSSLEADRGPRHVSPEHNLQRQTLKARRCTPAGAQGQNGSAGAARASAPAGAVCAGTAPGGGRKQGPRSAAGLCVNRGARGGSGAPAGVRCCRTAHGELFSDTALDV